MAFNIKTRIWTVKKGDWLTKIAASVYCDQSYWNVIYKANKEQIDNYNYEKYADGKYNKIYVDQELYCPLINSGVKKITDYHSSSWYTIRINDIDVQLNEGLDINIPLNGIIRSASFKLPYTESMDYKQNDPVEIYVKGELKIKGFLIKPNPAFSKQGGSYVTWEAVTPSYDLARSHFKSSVNESRTFKNISLNNLCIAILRDSGLTISFQNQEDRNIKVKKATIAASSTIFDFLNHIFETKGLFLHGLSDGNMVAIKNNDYPKKILRFYNSTENIIPTYDYDGLAQEYRAIETKTSTGSYKTATNDLIERNIFITIQKDSNFEGDLQEFVDHYQAKKFANAFHVSITDSNLLDDDGNVWTPNGMIKAFSNTIGFGDPKEFLINNLKFKFTKTKKSAILDCVLPETRSNEMPEELPFL